MTLQKPTVQQIRKLCTDISFERGKLYYKSGSVKSARICRSVISAQVLGTYEYCVQIRMPIYGHDFSSCTCPYDHEGVCKHIVAVLLHASKNLGKMLAEEKQRILDIDDAIQHASAESLRAFFTRYMESDDLLLRHFLTRFGKLNDMHPRDYRGEIRRLHDDISNDYDYDYESVVDLKEFFDAAKTYDERGEVAEAIRIYRDIVGAMTDDSDPEEVYRYDLDDLARAVDCMASCILRQNPDYLHKCRHISYLFEQSMKDSMYYFASVYRDALGKICTDSRDLVYWRGLVDTATPDCIPGKKTDYHGHLLAEMLVDMKIDVLERMGDGSVADLYQAHYRDDSNRCLRYVRYLKGSDPDRAIQVAEEGICLFGSRQIMDAACGLYKRTDPRRLALLERLFQDTTDWKYYDALMDASQDRRSTAVESVILRLRNSSRFSDMIDVMIREGLFERAASEAVACKDIHILRAHHKTLCPRYPELYYAAYKTLISKSPIGATRNDYREVAGNLKSMKSIPGHKKEFTAFVNSLRRLHYRRPAFLDEIKSV